MKIGIIAGEKSGDLLGSDLVAAIKLRYPNAQFKGLAGPLMQAQGVESLADMDKFSIMGVAEVLKNVVYLFLTRRRIRKTLLAWKPDIFIGIDAPDLNLNIEVALKEAGIPTVHYVSPTVWAWRGHRIHKIRRAVSLMLTLFPFEKTYYEKQNIRVAFVGHPLAKQVQGWQLSQSFVETINNDKDQRVIALLPGSRMSEVSRLAPIMFDVVEKLQQQRDDVLFVLPAAKDELYDYLESMLAQHGAKVCLLKGQSRDVLAVCESAVLASGTAALEAGLFAKPMIVMYKVAKLEQWYAARTMQVSHFSMPNHLLTPPPVPELIQDNASAEQLHAHLQKLLDDKAYFQQMKDRLALIAPQLDVDSAQLACDAIFDLLDSVKAKQVEKSEQ